LTIDFISIDRDSNSSRMPNGISLKLGTLGHAPDFVRTPPTESSADLRCRHRLDVLVRHPDCGTSSTTPSSRRRSGPPDSICKPDNRNFDVVGILRLKWGDPKLVFAPRRYGRDFKVIDRPEFRKLANENGLLYRFWIQNQQGRRLSQGASVVILPRGHATYLEQFSAVLQAPDFEFLQFPFDQQKFFIRVVSSPPKSFVKYVPLEGYSGFGEQLGE
jgi:hypothetical protein